MKRLAAMVLALTAACAEAPQGPEPILLEFPAMRSFHQATPTPPQRPNSEIAQDFLDLAFRMESGQPLPILTRFETPITVRTSGAMPPQMSQDLDALLARLRNEAQIDIRRTNARQANIVIEAVTQRQLQSVAPAAACFVVPRVQSWAELRRSRNNGALEWATLARRETAAIFIPVDTPPQEARDCLHEELAQGLGPLNDLYRLPDSVYNDDNMHAVLTGFDMLILRVFYDRELRSGMSRADVAARLPGILARLNPRGQRGGGDTAQPTPRAWITAIETALSGSGSENARRAAAGRAVTIGDQIGWGGPRAGFAQYAYGRLQISNDSSRALIAFNAANRAYSASSLTDIHAAHVAVQMAAFSLQRGDAEATIAITDAAIPVARRYENASLLALLMMFKAEALDIQGNTTDGMALRVDSLAWARYGFGSRDDVIERLNEIASLAPLARTN